jgi:hypothetical protein
MNLVPLADGVAGLDTANFSWSGIRKTCRDRQEHSEQASHDRRTGWIFETDFLTSASCVT